METFGGTISASRLKTYIQCPFKYYIEYILGIKKGDTFPTKSGTLVHKVLEKMAWGHRRHWKHIYLHFFRKYKPHLLHKDWEALPRTVEKRLLEDIDEFEGHAEDLVGLCQGKSDPLWLFAEGISLIEDVLSREFNPLNAKIISPEKKFRIPIGDGITITGIIDLVSEVEPGVLEIRDWKSGNFIPKYEESKEDPQLRLYDLAASILYPDHEIRMLTFDYIKSKTFPYTFVINDEEREENRRWIIGVAKQIEADMNPRRISSRPEGFWKCKALCLPEDCNREYPGRKEKLLQITNEKEKKKNKGKEKNKD